MIENKGSRFSGNYYSSFKLFESNIDQNESMLRRVDNSISNVSMEVMFKINENRNDYIKQQYPDESFIMVPSSEIINEYIGETKLNIDMDDKRLKYKILINKEKNE
jgi:hypothetical protein